MRTDPPKFKVGDKVFVIYTKPAIPCEFGFPVTRALRRGDYGTVVAIPSTLGHNGHAIVRVFWPELTINYGRSNGWNICDAYLDHDTEENRIWAALLS